MLSLSLSLSLYIYIYKTSLTSNEIFSPSNKIDREVSRAKDLSAPPVLYFANKFLKLYVCWKKRFRIYNQYMFKRDRQNHHGRICNLRHTFMKNVLSSYSTSKAADMLEILLLYKLCNSLCRLLHHYVVP